MARDLEPMQQQQEKQVPSAEAAVGLEGGDIGGADARQQNSEIGVGVRLNAGGCRWPDNTSANEMQAWSERLWVSLAMVVGASSVGRIPGKRTRFASASPLYLWLRSYFSSCLCYARLFALFCCFFVLKFAEFLQSTKCQIDLVLSAHHSSCSGGIARACVQGSYRPDVLFIPPGTWHRLAPCLCLPCSHVLLRPPTGSVRFCTLLPDIFISPPQDPPEDHLTHPRITFGIMHVGHTYTSINNSCVYY